MGNGGKLANIERNPVFDEFFRLCFINTGNIPYGGKVKAKVKCKICGKVREPSYMRFCKQCYSIELLKIKESKGGVRH